jgi:transposase
MIRLENEIRKKVFCLILQGYSLVEIAEKLGVSKRTSERFKNNIKEILTLQINQGLPKK